MHDLFLYAAVLGGALFLAQLVLSALGAGDADIDFGGHHGLPTGHTSADTAFKLLSLQGASSFFAMFGLIGLALSEASGWPVGYALVGAALGGGCTTLIITRIFRAAKQLEGSGNLNMANATGAEATVYLRVAPQKPGKVTVIVQGRLVQVEAVSEDNEVFETGARVRVLRARSDGSLVVGKF